MLNPSNNVVLRGNLTRDAEIVGSKNNVAKMSVAVSNSGNDSDDRENRTGFFDLICFLDNASCGSFVRRMISENNLEKGSGVEIIGSLSHSRWSGDGGRRSRVEIIVEGFSFASSGNRDGEHKAQAGGGDIDKPVEADDFVDF